MVGEFREFPYPAPLPDRSIRPISSGLAVMLLLALLAGFLGFQLLNRPATGPVTDPTAAPRDVVPRGNLADFETTVIDLFREASPSVVFIQTHNVRRDRFSLNLFRIPRGTGSGFIWDERGTIVTNFHVIQGAEGADVTLADRSTWPARVVGIAPDHDLAVLKIDAPTDRLRPIPVGTSGDLVVGQTVLAIGNPFGLDQTLTTGIISGIGREIESVTGHPITGVIQTDAAINPGNSGGPLLDSAGRLIGVNTMILSESGNWAGIGFAVPVDTVNRIVPQLIRTGKVARAGLGVQVAEDSITRRLDISGVLVMGVVPGSPAEKAGIRPTRRNARGEIELGDIIVAIDDSAIATTTDLHRLLDGKRPGESVTLTVERGGDTQKIPLELHAIN